MPTLYLVATPIGNLEDITLRALRILGEVPLIAAEDTRHTRGLLTHYDINTPLISYHEYSDDGRLDELLDHLASADLALVTDAGTPSISDPGYRIVQAAIDAGVTITPIPGPSAALTALIGSGLPTDAFLFLGFLPKKQKARQEALTAVATLPYTLILYESPRRLLDLLADIETVMGAERHVVVGRELTKKFEEFWRGPAPLAQKHFATDTVRGECTLLIAPAPAQDHQWTEADIRHALQTQLNQGIPRKQAAATIAKQSGWRKRQIYNLSLDL
ncbi:MAG TPA: 16S rRNA (cytidine(1402)-2'-O)-methyltransferase [Anaerolineae bacterium]|nr:16S rRNA (cytidine(1402)-2'-O)-methyltransferase [Anaerolineae bacterium]